MSNSCRKYGLTLRYYFETYPTWILLLELFGTNHSPWNQKCKQTNQKTLTSISWCSPSFDFVSIYNDIIHLQNTRKRLSSNSFSTSSRTGSKYLCAIASFAVKRSYNHQQKSIVHYDHRQESYPDNQTNHR